MLGITLKCAILFGFYAFLRQSNLAPKTAAAFDIRRNTCRGDVICHPPGLVILLKWTKTLQKGQRTLIPIPSIPGHPLCPVQAFNAMQTAIAATYNDPLLVLKKDTGLAVLTIDKLRSL
jgi:hypothetical protein